MAAYILKRLGLAALILVVASVILIALIHVIPGDPVSAALGPRATPEMKLEFAHRMGLDKPFPVQVATFLWNVLHGDLGFDVWTGRSVTTLIAEVLPYTLALAAAALTWAIGIGVPLGCWTALRQGGRADRILGAISIGTIAVPSFVVGVYALLLFSVKLHWLPAMGAGENGPGDIARHLILPSLAVGLGWVGYLARLVRSAMIEVMHDSHIRAARAFGVPEHVVVYRYALRLAIVPAVTVLGIAVSSLIASSVFAEIVFNRPGLGRLAYDAVATRNYPVVMGTVFFTTFLYLVCTLAADLAVMWLDPRTSRSL
jgi:peptide/nickel transport system permease protein